MWRVLFSLAALLVLSVEAHATDFPELLAGVKAVDVLSDAPSPDAEWCGVSKDMLRSTAILVLKKNTTLSINENASLPFVYVNLTAAKLGELGLNACAGYLSVVLDIYEEVKRDDRSVLVVVPVWVRGTVLVYNRGAFANEVKSYVTDYVEQFSAAWLMQNQSNSASTSPPLTHGSAP